MGQLLAEQVPVDTSVWQKVVRHMYEQTDFTKIRDTLQAEPLYSQFMKAILDFQIREHERYLAQINRVFSQVDTQGTGQLSEEQFREMLGNMGLGLGEQEIQHYLELVDPWATNKANYSEIIQLLTTQEVAGVDSQTSCAILSL